MIRRRAKDMFILIPQTEHARLAAELVPQLGNAFVPACDITGLAQAAALHEAGYRELDERPMLSPAGRPAHYRELPLIPLLHAWQRSADLAGAGGPYAQMLVSLLVLQRSSALPSTTRTLREVFEINKLQHREIERQEGLRPTLGLRNDVSMRYGLPEPVIPLTPAEQRFVYDYRLLVMLSQISLESCANTQPSGDLALTPRAPGHEAQPIAFRWRDPAHPNLLILTPWPFAEDAVALRFSGRLIPVRSFEHEMELEEALETAPLETIEVVLGRA